MRPTHTRTAGFTIVELLIVIVIIGILAALVIITYSGLQQRALVSQQQAAVLQYVKAFSLYTSEHGTYPYTGTSGQIACIYSYATACSSQNPAVTASLASNMQQYLSSTPNFNRGFTMSNSTLGSYTGPYFYIQFAGNITCPDISGLVWLNTTSGDPTACRYRPAVDG